ncbi:hypothetical protein ACWGOK_25205 [Streptomyces eurythermus]
MIVLVSTVQDNGVRYVATVIIYKLRDAPHCVAVQAVALHLHAAVELRTRSDALDVTDLSFSHIAILKRIDHLCHSRSAM